MRHPSLVPLSHDHHHGLALALRCRKQALGQMRPMGLVGLRERAAEVRELFERNLIAHFRAEEEVLFPRVEKKIPETEPIVEQLRREHETLRAAVEQLSNESRLAKTIFDLGDLLERHIRKEERELFPLIEKRLDAAEVEAIGAIIRQVLVKDEKLMEKYGNLGGDSGVVSYDSLSTSIKIQFVNNSTIYVYTYSKPGKIHVEKMKQLARAGRGLATYISQKVRDDYDYTE